MPMNNKERAEHAYRASLHYAQSRTGDYSQEETITDLICDLLHCAKDYGDPAKILRTAIKNFVAEELDEDETCLDPDIAPFVREAFEQVL